MPLRVGVVYWDRDDGLGREAVEILTGLDHEPIHFMYDDLIPQDLDLVLTFGPYDSLVPLANQLLVEPVTIRPLFLWWLTEQLPNPRLPGWLLDSVGRLRSSAERQAFSRQPDGRWTLRPGYRWLTERAHRYRYYGDLCWLRKTGLPFMLITGSPWRAGYLRAKGFHPYTHPSPNYRPGWGEDLKLERDIPVLWLGKMGTSRRKHLLGRVRKDLTRRGVEMHVVDGEENSYIFGEERTHLLNRSKIVLNILREKWDNHVGRFTLAAQNRALLITEPVLPHTSFQPGVHMVQAPVEQIPDLICHYLSHDDEREDIIDRAQRLIMQNTRQDTFARLLELAAQLRENTGIPEISSTGERELIH